jgi:hypothetical protein
VSRTRALIVVALIVVFVLVVGVVIYANSHPGGQNRTFNVTVSAAKSMAPSTLQPAHLGDTITINITSDQSGEVHLHEYDIPFDAEAGKTVSHTFKADKTCTCLLEWESTSTPLGNLIVSP